MSNKKKTKTPQKSRLDGAKACVWKSGGHEDHIAPLPDLKHGTARRKGERAR